MSKLPFPSFTRSFNCSLQYPLKQHKLWQHQPLTIKTTRLGLSKVQSQSIVVYKGRRRKLFYYD